MNLVESVTGKLDALYDAALAMLYPQTCAVCEAASVEARNDAPVCASCWRQTRVFSGAEALCWKCGVLGPVPLTTVPEEKKTQVSCHRCDSEHFTAARAAGVYEAGLRAAVLRLKREPHVGARVVRLMYEAQKRPPLNSATRIVPVPLHPTRERERGFNQAVILGRALAPLTKLPLDESSLARATYTARHRAGMDARARRETVEDAFVVQRPRLIEGEHVLLIDDVFTTGATVSSCARALREAGAEAVLVLTIARA